MIFVTVGTAHYNPLIKTIDQLVAQKRIEDYVIAQIGRGSYIPENIPFFRFIKSLNKAYEYANLVISTGGAGTTLECTRRGLPLIVLENKSLMEGHQAQLIGEMERRGHLVWCKELADLVDCISIAKQAEFTRFLPDEPVVHQLILNLLE